MVLWDEQQNKASSAPSYSYCRPGLCKAELMGSVLSFCLFTNLWCDVQALLNDLAPETGTVTDNSDGSHSTVYAITRAGIYRMAIQSAPLHALASQLRDHPQMFGTCSRPQGSGDLPLQTRPPYSGRVSSESSLHTLSIFCLRR
jgi:hypothetical protein